MNTFQRKKVYFVSDDDKDKDLRYVYFEGDDPQDAFTVHVSKLKTLEPKPFNPSSKYKVGHNMRPYLAQAIYELRPNLVGVFTEKDKSGNGLSEARGWLKDNPAFLTMVDTYIETRGTDEPIAIQFFVELYRWDETTKDAVAATNHPDVVAARLAQEATWKAQHEAENA